VRFLRRAFFPIACERIAGSLFLTFSLLSNARLLRTFSVPLSLPELSARSIMCSSLFMGLVSISRVFLFAQARFTEDSKKPPAVFYGKE